MKREPIKYEYNDEEHTYKINDECYPSPSTILGLLSEIAHIPQEVLKKAGLRGTHCHTLTELYDRGKLAVTAIPADHMDGMAYLNGYRKFREQNKDIKTLEIETRVLSMEHKYTGRLDRIYKQGKKIIVGDVKSSAWTSWTWGCQTSAYMRAKNEDNIINWEDKKVVPVTDRMIVHLHKDSTFDIIDESAVVELSKIDTISPAMLKHGFMLPHDTCLQIFDECKSLYNIRRKLKAIEKGARGR